ncbi:MAG: RsmD family RNA methyltransferase [Victivallaceae bacterium]|nr:RsmD family RNA methyltransferase [Victivallaceae bacterium]
MRIIAGYARNLELETPPGLGVRPTAGRSRKALFDSIGAAIEGASVVDIFAGSGALGLEAASRGAAEVLFVEKSSAHIGCIERNLERVRRVGVEAGVEIISADAAAVERYAAKLNRRDFIFADPPYAQSAEFFAAIYGAPLFREKAAGACLYWELPDQPGEIGRFLELARAGGLRVRQFGGANFLCGEIKP